MRRVGDVVCNAGNVHKGLDGFGVVYYTAVQYTDCKKPLAGTLTNDMIFLLLSRRERETEEVRRRAGDRNYPKKSRPHFVTLELGCDFSSDRGEEEEDARRHLNRKQSVGNYVHIRGRHPTKPIVYELREKESKRGTYYFLASSCSQQSTMCDVISLDLEITMQTTHYLYPNARIFHFFS